MELLTLLFTSKLKTLQFFRKEVYELNKEIIDNDPQEQLRYAHLDGQIAALQECIQDSKRHDQGWRRLRKSRQAMFCAFAFTALLINVLKITDMIIMGFNWDKLGICIWSITAALATYDHRFFQKSPAEVLGIDLEEKQPEK